MKIFYEADDGEKFDNEEDCLFHELENILPDSTGLALYDKEGRLICGSLFNIRTYEHIDSIIIPTQDALTYINKISDYCGLRNLFHFSSLGTYKWTIGNNNKGYFKKECGNLP